MIFGYWFRHKTNEWRRAAIPEIQNGYRYLLAVDYDLYWQQYFGYLYDGKREDVDNGKNTLEEASRSIDTYAVSRGHYLCQSVEDEEKCKLLI